MTQPTTAHEHERRRPNGRTSGVKKASKVFARSSGHLAIGGDLEVHRLGFGAMSLTGDGRWGEPEDHDGAVNALRTARAMGVNFIDTADSYGPNVSEELIREALYPYEGFYPDEKVVIATKGGHTRQGPGKWVPLGRPEYLRQSVLMSLDRLGTDQLDVWQLHRIDPKVPRGEQFDAMRQMRDEGLVRHLGLSGVSVEDIEDARQAFPVATVQNRYNLADRASEEVVDYCEENGIAFIAWAPLASGDLAREGGILDEVAGEAEARPEQVALAWLLQRSPAIIAVPGTANAGHIRENVRAAAFQLSAEDYRALDEAGRRASDETRRRAQEEGAQDREAAAP